MNILTVRRFVEVAPNCVAQAEPYRFDADEAERYVGRQELQGMTRVDVHTGLSTRAQSLWCTADGCYVLEEHNPWADFDEYTRRLITPESAMEWLERNGDHDAAMRVFREEFERSLREGTPLFGEEES